MASPSLSHRHEDNDDSDTQNPNFSQDEENRQPQEPEQQPQSQPHSPQIRTLESSDPQNQDGPGRSDPQDHHQQQLQQQQGDSTIPAQEQQDLHDHREGSGMSLCPPPTLLPPIPEAIVTVSDIDPPPLTSPTNPHRRPNKRKKGNRGYKKQQLIGKKLQTLSENLKPIPFRPSKTLDFAKHEKLFKRLGLWDFVHIEFDRIIRVDLIAQLIATYDPKLRCSYVNEFRIAVNRADLARAFKFPVKKEKGNDLEGVDLDLEVLSEDSISFVEDFVSNWVLLHEDMWMMPTEVLNWTRAINEGHPEKVDWASLIWFMMEKELTRGEQLEDCYYASHFQYLIKSQREDVLREEPKVTLEVELKEEEGGGGGGGGGGSGDRDRDAKMDGPDEFQGLEGEEDGGGESDGKMDGPDEFQVQDNVVLEEHNIELTLGHDTAEEEEATKDEEMMDLARCKEEEHGRWLLSGKNSAGEHFLQHCNLEDWDSHDERKQEDEEGVEEEEPEDGFNMAPNRDIFESDGLTGNLLQGMEMSQIPFSSSGQFCDPSAAELLASRAESDAVSGGPSILGNAGKRVIGHEQNISNHFLNGSSKRLRTDGPWDHKSSDFGMCMEQGQQWMDKARMMYEAKEHAYEELNMNQQILLDELQRRGSVIEHLHKTKCEELQKRDGEIHRLERELYVMGTLLEGYRTGLKDTHKTFSEYRQLCLLPEEPIYKDAGPGGVVLSITELEKLPQKQEEEEEDRLNRILVEQKLKDIEEEYIGKLEAHLDKVRMLDNRLMDIENEGKLLKELAAKPKVSETSGCAPNE